MVKKWRRREWELWGVWRWIAVVGRQVGGSEFIWSVE